MFLLDATTSNNPIWEVIITTIIGSTVISSIVTLLWNNKLKKDEFEWNYKNYILNKRKEAYEYLYPVVMKFFNKQVDNIGEYSIVIFTFSMPEIIVINEQLLNCKTYQEWCTKDMVDFLYIFSQYFATIIVGKDETDLEDLSVSEYTNMSKYEKQFTQLYWNDIQNLHKIREFINSKKDT